MVLINEYNIGYNHSTKELTNVIFQVEDKSFFAARASRRSLSAQQTTWKSACADANVELFFFALREMFIIQDSADKFSADRLYTIQDFLFRPNIISESHI